MKTLWLPALLGIGVLLGAATGVQAQSDVTASRDDESGLRPVEVVVTTQEVKAVQAALLSRGYYRTRPNGVLNAETRTALREFQAENQLNPTGKIDRATLDALEIVPGQRVSVERRNGVLPKIGYGVKDGAVATKNGVVKGAKTIGNGVQTGAVKTKDLTVGAAHKTRDVTLSAFGKTRDVTVNAGHSTQNGAKTVGRKGTNAVQRAGNVIVGRSDTDIHVDVRNALEADANERQLVTSVKAGTVTIRVPQGFQGDVSPTISRVRKVGGVRSVLVVYN